MGNIIAHGKIKKAKISAKVYRIETGEWENLGMIAKSKESTIKRIIKWLF